MLSNVVFDALLHGQSIQSVEIERDFIANCTDGECKIYATSLVRLCDLILRTSMRKAIESLSKIQRFLYLYLCNLMVFTLDISNFN